MLKVWSGNMSHNQHLALNHCKGSKGRSHPFLAEPVSYLSSGRLLIVAHPHKDVYLVEGLLGMVKGSQ